MGANILESAWYRFWQDCAMARNHQRALGLLTEGYVPKDAFLDSLLPSQLFIHLVCLLDEGLALAPALEKSSRAGRRPQVRTAALSARSARTTVEPLRKRRDALIHESGTYASWSELDDAVTEVEVILKRLSLIGERPRLEFYGQRTPVEADEPDHDHGFRYEWGLKESDGEWSLRLETTSWVHRT